MTLLDDWRGILRRAWSVRAAVLSAACSVAEVVQLVLPQAMPFVQPGTFAVLSAAFAVAVPVLRILSQSVARDGA